MGRRAWGAAALVAAVFSVLVLAPSAQAAFGLNGLSATPASTDAGANTDLAISIGITDPEADLRDLTIHLPPGLVGNPQATSMCTVEQLNADGCPPVTEVGTTTTNVNAFLAALPLLPIPLTVNGTIYNLVPQPGEPARFGIVLRPLSVPRCRPSCRRSSFSPAPACGRRTSDSTRCSTACRGTPWTVRCSSTSPGFR